MSPGALAPSSTGRARRTVRGPTSSSWSSGRRGCGTAIDVATGGGHVARRLREAGLEVVSCDPAPGMQPDVICFAEELPFADGELRPRGHCASRRTTSPTSRQATRELAASRAGGSSSSTTSTWATTARGGREDPRPLARPQLHRGGVARLLRRRRHRGRGGRRSSRTRSSSSPGSSAPSCTGADAERVRELLADRITGGDVVVRADRAPREAGRLMAILVDGDTRLVVQGLTGSEGRFHGLRNRAYGTNVVAGVTPGKGGQDVEGIPVFDTVAEAVAETGANTSLIFVPARFAADAVYEAVDAGIGDGRLHHRAHPGARHAQAARLRPRARRDDDRPELPRRALARQGQRRDHPGRGLRRRARRARLPLGHAHLPDRQRARPARDRQLDDRRHRRRPGRSARRSSTSSTASRPTPRRS